MDLKKIMCLLEKLCSNVCLNLQHKHQIVLFYSTATDHDIYEFKFCKQQLSKKKIRV